MIEVWHAKQFAPFDTGTPRVWPADYVKVAEVATDDRERAFELTNHIDRAWFTNPGVVAFDAPKLRSTSVGDVIVQDGKAWRCEAMGWQELPIPAHCPHEAAKGSR